MTDQSPRDLWLAERRKHITATDVAAILGVSPWRTQMQVWLDKKGLVEEEDSERMRWGRKLERLILEGYSEAVGQELRLFEYVFTSSTVQPLLGASLDAQWESGDHRPVDAKNIQRKDSDEWGDPESGDVPKHYAAQLAVQMHVTDAPAADLAVLFGGNRLERFTVERDREIEEIILEQVGEWWERHIVKDIPPPMDGSERTSKWLTSKWKKSTGLILLPTVEQINIASEIKKVRDEIKEAETERATLENMLKSDIGAAEGIEGVASWKFDKEGKVLDKDAYIAELENVIKSIPGAGIWEKAVKDMRKKFTKPKPPVRRFLLKEGKQ
ncbi:MAG: YqaJ-like viral recombinase domain protein [Candidatus Latescibacteria bacterium ADurb.Bin168]|nr:MAG: YqaJ-like viral recombinase domain protein [Candidatus Latescibacteria bacterium ADurb.Bin168]